MFCTSRFVILKLLKDKKNPISIAYINKELSKIKNEKVLACNTKKEFVFLQMQGYIHYCYEGKKINRTYWIKITRQGEEYYNYLISEFLKKYNYIERVYNLIKNDIS